MKFKGREIPKDFFLTLDTLTRTHRGLRYRIPPDPIEYEVITMRSTYARPHDLLLKVSLVGRDTTIDTMYASGLLTDVCRGELEITSPPLDEEHHPIVVWLLTQTTTLKGVSNGYPRAPLASLDSLASPVPLGKHPAPPDTGALATDMQDPPVPGL
jgi:hypothetical protein